jgi:uncharacterized radical SAM superfamily Fe-S cluster-containing enzyme
MGHQPFRLLTDVSGEPFRDLEKELQRNVNARLKLEANYVAKKEENSIQAFHVMAKPTGSRCNLSCDYCFFQKKKYLYPDSDFCMSDEVMETYIRQTIEAHKCLT